MSIGQSVAGIVKVAIIGGCIYAVVKYGYLDQKEGDLSDYVEDVCIDAIAARYDTSQVKPYDVQQNANGYVVRTSVTMSRGSMAKVYCLTNELGGVRELTLQE